MWWAGTWRDWLLYTETRRWLLVWRCDLVSSLCYIYLLFFALILQFVACVISVCGYYILQTFGIMLRSCLIIFNDIYCLLVYCSIPLDTFISFICCKHSSHMTDFTMWLCLICQLWIKIHVESSGVSGEPCGELTFLCNGDRICTQEKKRPDNNDNDLSTKERANNWMKRKNVGPHTGHRTSHVCPSHECKMYAGL